MCVNAVYVCTPLMTPYLLTSMHRYHEWCKHGTCSDMPDEHTFFETILNLYDDGLQFGDILRNQGIVPAEDSSYSVSSVVCNVSTDALVVCIKDTISGPVLKLGHYFQY